MSAPAIPSAIQMRRLYPGAGAPSTDRPTRKIDETAVGNISVDPAPYLLFATHTSRSSEYLLKIAPQRGILPVLAAVPGMDPPSLPQRVSSQAEPAQFGAVPMSGNELQVPVASVAPSPLSARLSLDRETDGLEQPREMAKAPAEDQIARLRRQLEEQQVVNASFEERLGRLESARKVVPAAGVIETFPPVRAADVIETFPPDARETRFDQPQADAETNPDATVGGADTAERVQTCELAKSVWDSPLFLGRPDLEMGHVVTLWAVLVLLLNILLQVTIAVIVVLNMGDPTFAARVIEDLWSASEPRFAAA
jgi:hypothetical protein